MIYIMGLDSLLPVRQKERTKGKMKIAINEKTLSSPEFCPRPFDGSDDSTVVMIVGVVVVDIDVDNQMAGQSRSE